MLHFLLLICPYDLTRATHKFSNRLFAAVPFQFLKLKSGTCLLYTSPSPRDRQKSRMPSSA